MNIPKETLLAVILEHSDYLDFRKTGDGYRSSTAKNPSLVLSEDGWYDHKQGQGGSLLDSPKIEACLMRQRDELVWMKVIESRPKPSPRRRVPAPRILPQRSGKRRKSTLTKSAI